MKDNRKLKANVNSYSNIEATSVRWLWYPYIPYGKLTLLQGDPGEGKSTFMIQVAAALTKGEALPGCSKPEESVTVIYQCSEDGLSDTVKPRLMEAGADCSRVVYIMEEEAPLTLDDNRIEDAIAQTGARLMIIDPIQAFMGQDLDWNNAVKIRHVLKNLSNTAQKYSCAIVMIGHMNKAAGGKNLYRGLGSIDIAAIARSVLMISRDKEEPWKRYMFPVKSSLAPEGQPICFELGENKGFRWIGKCEVNIEDLLQQSTSSIAKKETAAKYLKTLLMSNDIQSSVIFEKFNMMGISHRTVQEAKKEMGIQSYRKGNAWYWHLDMEE